MAHCSAILCPQVTLSGDAEWPKVADAVIEAADPFAFGRCCQAVDGVADGYAVLPLRTVDTAAVQAFHTMPSAASGTRSAVTTTFRRWSAPLAHYSRACSEPTSA